MPRAGFPEGLADNQLLCAFGREGNGGSKTYREVAPACLFAGVAEAGRIKVTRRQRNRTEFTDAPRSLALTVSRTCL